MRIAFDYQAFCRQSAGGISRYFCRLAEQLHARRETVGIFAPLYRNQYLAQVRAELVRGTFLKSYPPKTAEAIVAMNRWLSRGQVRGWKPQVTHETYFSRKSVAPSGCPVVLTVFDMIPELQEQTGERARDTWHATAKYAAVARADHVICISECTRQDLMALFGIQPEKVSVAHLGCDLLSDAGEASDRKAPQGRPHLLYVGLREGYKNFETMLRGIATSVRLMQDFDLVAFGGGALTAPEQALISALGYRRGQVIQCVGDDRALAALYRSAAAFVYPSTYEGFGLPPLEAMLQDCPVVCSNRSSIPEVVAGSGQYFDPDNPESIARAIEDVVYSPDRATELIAAGRQRAAHFTWDRCAERHLEVYRTLVSP